MRMLTPVLLSLLLLTGCAAAPSEEVVNRQDETANHQEKVVSRQDENGYRQIPMEEAAAMMAEEEDYIILDVRTAEEYAAGHIPDAVNIPNETIGSEDIPELPEKEQMILVYCRSGNRSKQASKKLADAGYTNVIEFGGINDWTGETVTE